MGWKRKYINDRQAELKELTKVIEKLSSRGKQTQPTEELNREDDLTGIDSLRREIQESIDELGWAESKDWFGLSGRVERSLRELREAVRGTSGWLRARPGHDGAKG